MYKRKSEIKVVLTKLLQKRKLLPFNGLPKMIPKEVFSIAV